MKKIFILGDSYSTFKDYIPKINAAYYPNLDVNDVSLTWWHKLISDTESQLVLNDSWSGSTVCHTGYNGADCSHSSSFIYRVQKLFDEKFFDENQIDTFLVFGGTNDSWAGSSLGEMKFSSFTESDLFSVRPAICCLMDRLTKSLPNTVIFFIVNTDLKEGIVDCIEEAANVYNFTPIVLRDIDKQSGHPTMRGMDEIYRQVKNVVC